LKKRVSQNNIIGEGEITSTRESYQTETFSYFYLD